jgi:hypothetical protein
MRKIKKKAMVPFRISAVNRALELVARAQINGIWNEALRDF